MRKKPKNCHKAVVLAPVYATLWLWAGPTCAFTAAHGVDADSDSGTAPIDHNVSPWSRHLVRQAKQLPAALRLPNGDWGASLIDQAGASPADLLAHLAPNLASCQLTLTATHQRGDVAHRFYGLTFSGYPLYGAYLHLHQDQHQQLLMLRSNLPNFTLPSQGFSAADFRSLEELGEQAADGFVDQVTAVLADGASAARPAWQILRQDLQDRQTSELLIDAQTGELIEQRDLSFNATQVYAKSPADGALTSVTLPDLKGDRYLDGEHFTVYAPTAGDPRAEADDNQFNFDPNDAGSSLSFDQAQTYYGATRALSFFHDQFGYDMGATPMVVSIDTLINGSAANAAYMITPAGPEILIGKGDDTLTNLARDSAVISHEFTHHIIFQFVTARSGESGVLHEGTADYFAYAINDDPCLGESIVPGGRCLRTALLADGDRFDAQPVTTDIHLLGQYWSAVLWQLRIDHGASIDKLVYHALPYLGPDAGMEDAFLALLNADRDLNPLPSTDPDAGKFGALRCAILEGAVTRGFAQYLTNYDGSACGLDLSDLAAQSLLLAQEVAKGDLGDHKKMNIKLFGKACAVVAAETGSERTAALIMFLPFALALAARGPRSKAAPAAAGRRGDQRGS